MHPAVKNNKILEIYLSLCESIYTDPDNEVIVGSFFNEVGPHVPQLKRTYHASRNVQQKKISYDTRTLFSQQRSTHEMKDVRKREVDFSVQPKDQVIEIESPCFWKGLFYREGRILKIFKFFKSF